MQSLSTENILFGWCYTCICPHLAQVQYSLVRINSPAFIRRKTYIVAATLQLFTAYSSRLLLQILLP